MTHISKRIESHDVTFETDPTDPCTLIATIETAEGYESARYEASVPVENHPEREGIEAEALSALQDHIDRLEDEQATERQLVLAAQLDCYWFQCEEIRGDHYGEGTCFTVMGEQGEYAVLDSDERDRAVRAACESYIDECILPEIPEVYRNYFDSAAWIRDVRLSGDDDSMISPYDRCVNEQCINGVWYYVIRTN